MGGHDVVEAISDYYDRLVGQYGYSYKACDCGNPLYQQVKFYTPAEDLDFSRKSILDVGCGAGNFADYLAQRRRDVCYAGIDLSKKLVGMAQHLHPNLDIRQASILTRSLSLCDVVMANGIFCLLAPDAPRLMEEIIVKMYRIARLAVAFNSLSAWAKDMEAGEVYADPLATVEFCRQLTPWIALRHDYHSRDFTVYLYKRNR